tara:strand:- start:525 stop:821 length:297 start_codon:yes stop_codon:yes gene_type:complete
MSKKNNNLDSLIEESLDNVRQDRAIASTLLVDLVTHIKGNKHEHKETGQVAAKYLETLQRSNEQLVKLNTLLFKKSSITTGLTEDDKEELYDLISKED